VLAFFLTHKSKLSYTHTPKRNFLSAEITFDAAYDLFQSMLEDEGFKAVPEGDCIRIIKE
jgi:hypothetical protein